MRVRKRGRTSMLKEIRPLGPFTRLRAVEMTSAAKLVGIERLASALTRDHAPIRVFLQRPRTRGQQIRLATDNRTHAFTLVRRYRHGDVEAVDEADGVGGLVGVAVVEAELS